MAELGPLRAGSRARRGKVRRRAATAGTTTVCCQTDGEESALKCHPCPAPLPGIKNVAARVEYACAEQQDKETFA